MGSCLTVVLLHNLFEAWSAYPTYTTIDNVAAPVSELPFPTVTVCRSSGDAVNPTPAGGWAYPREVLDAYRLRHDYDDGSSQLTEFAKDMGDVIGLAVGAVVQKMKERMDRVSIRIEDFIPMKLESSRIFVSGAKSLLCGPLSNFSTEAFLGDISKSYGSQTFSTFIKRHGREDYLNLTCDDNQEKAIVVAYMLLWEAENFHHLGT